MDEHGPSKSQRKREHRELQLLAETLIALPEGRFRKLRLGERAREELEAARTMARGGSLNRQVRLIAQLLVDEDIEAISRPSQELEARAREETARHHAAEKLRERLLVEGEKALEAITATPEQRERARGLLRARLAGWPCRQTTGRSRRPAARRRRRSRARTHAGC